MTPETDLVSTTASERDRRFRALAQAAAEQARALGEVPVGAVLVRGDEVIATGFNHPIGGPVFWTTSAGLAPTVTVT